MVTTRTNLTTRCYRGRAEAVSLIGVHTMEAPEGSQTAENVAAYFQRVDASSQWTVDDDSRVRVVRDEDTAWTLPGANARSLNIEIAGYARQSADDWRDAFSLKALNIAALCAAEWCKKYDIPVRRLTDAQIRSKAKGFAGHVDVNRVYKKSSHWDPGPNFPWTYFLGLVSKHLDALGGGKPVPAPANPGWDNRGYSTAWISAQQAKLNRLGYDLVVDGKRGPATIAATKSFQATHGLTQDGIPGPATAKKLDAAVAARAKAKHHRRTTTAPTHVYGGLGTKRGRLLPKGYPFTVVNGSGTKVGKTWWVQTTAGNWVRGAKTTKAKAAAKKKG
ncbi:peptidoglycan recognition protein family protein [Isoptericola variabilis]|uniref:peptidoglycan recognition protein family protein n=1 Tax=Isoptericola variabilis TaxID=139208 RepID=UPI003D1FCF47